MHRRTQIARRSVNKRSPNNLIGNGLLAALPRRDFARLLPCLDEVRLPLRTMLSVSNQDIDYAYFPIRGMISLVRLMADGQYAETGLVGREGFVGVSLLHGTRRSPVEAMVQAEGAAMRIRAADLQAQIDRSPALAALLLSYAEMAYLQSTQIAACNGRHTLDKRLLRWLLEAHDRIGEDSMVLGQEFLAMMLGVRRAGVSVGLKDLRAAGFIKSGIRSVRIVDRAGMEAATCECYATSKAEAAALLPPLGARLNNDGVW